MDGFINRVKLETSGELVGDLDITRIPLDVYHAWNNTSRRWHESGARPPARVDPGVRAGGRGDRVAVLPVDLARASSARSSWRATSPTARCRRTVVFDRYENFMYRQWLRVYMRSQMIKHNKDVLAVIPDVDGRAREAARLLR